MLFSQDSYFQMSRIQTQQRKATYSNRTTHMECCAVMLPPALRVQRSCAAILILLLHNVVWVKVTASSSSSGDWTFSPGCAGCETQLLKKTPAAGWRLQCWLLTGQSEQEADLRAAILSLFLTALQCLLFSLCATIPVLPLQYLTFILQVVNRSFLYGGNAAFISVAWVSQVAAQVSARAVWSRMWENVDDKEGMTVKTVHANQEMCRYVITKSIQKCPCCYSFFFGVD